MNTIKRVKAGQPLNIPATAYNAMASAAEDLMAPPEIGRTPQGFRGFRQPLCAYSLERAKLSYTSGTATATPYTAEEPEYEKIVAINLFELVENTHFVEPGTPVIAFKMPMCDDANTVKTVWVWPA